ncbi:hypothetical protein Tco_0732578 [Tanacetum coccineum]
MLLTQMKSYVPSFLNKHPCLQLMIMKNLVQQQLCLFNSAVHNCYNCYCKTILDEFKTILSWYQDQGALDLGFKVLWSKNEGTDEVLEDSTLFPVLPLLLLWTERHCLGELEFETPLQFISYTLSVFVDNHQSLTHPIQVASNHGTTTINTDGSASRNFKFASSMDTFFPNPLCLAESSILRLSQCFLLAFAQVKSLAADTEGDAGSVCVWFPLVIMSHRDLSAVTDRLYLDFCTLT